MSTQTMHPVLVGTFLSSTLTLTLLTPTPFLGAAHKGVDSHSEQQHDTFNHLFHVRSLALQVKTIFQAADNECPQNDVPDRASTAKEAGSANNGCCDSVEEKRWVDLRCHRVCIRGRENTPHRGEC